MSLIERARLTGHTDRVWNVSWSPNGAHLSSSGGDKEVRVWSASGDPSGAIEGLTWNCTSTMSTPHSRTVRQTAWSPNGTRLASASFDSTIGVFELEEGEFELSCALEGHENEVKSVAWSASGQLLASCSRDKSVWIWALEDDGDFECLSVLHGHDGDVKTVLWHPNEELLLSTSYDDSIRLWKEDEEDWYCAAVLRGHGSTVWAASWNGDGSAIVTGSDDATIKLWKAQEGQDGVSWACVSTVSGHHDRAVLSVDWNASTGFIATGSSDDGLRVFGPDPEETDPLAPGLIRLATHPKAHTEVNSVAWNPVNPRMLATAGDDGVVKIWELVL